MKAFAMGVFRSFIGSCILSFGLFVHGAAAVPPATPEVLCEPLDGPATPCRPAARIVILADDCGTAIDIHQPPMAREASLTLQP